VTGASQGLGRHIAIALAANGAKVACVARNEAKLAETLEMIKAAGGDGEVMAGDVSQTETVQAIVEKVDSEWGSVDIVVNNAGITRDTLMPVMTDESSS